MKNITFCGKDGTGKSTTTQNGGTGLAKMSNEIIAAGRNSYANSAHPLLGGQQRKSLIDTLCKAGAEVDLIEIIQKWVQKNPFHRILWY